MMSPRLAVLNVVGLTGNLLDPDRTPALSRFAQAGAHTIIRPALPAVTCAAQATYITGQPPSAHGIVANGWYDRSLAEVHFWKQSNHLVQGTKIWDHLRRKQPGFTCAQLFWWFNMYSGADFSITPRPLYPADGRKVFDIHSWPHAIRGAIKHDLGPFPFPTFWGPAAGTPSPQGAPDAATRWIADSARWIEEKHRPTLSLVYLPHLDYNLQRLGPTSPAVPADLGRIDSIVGELIAFYHARGVRVLILSEYGITPVTTPIHLNRLFRAQGWITLKDELGLETLDCGACRAFAVADHQIAHIYLNDPSLLQPARQLLETTPGIARVLGPQDRAAAGLNHPRAGDLVAIAAENAWFTYYYWLDDARAPDFARTVDIHRKPGFDPVELFLDPGIPAVRLRILWRLLQKRLGFRMLMDVIPLDAALVRGSHGALPARQADWPVLLSDQPDLPLKDPVEATEVAGLIARLCT